MLLSELITKLQEIEKSHPDLKVIVSDFSGYTDLEEKMIDVSPEHGVVDFDVTL